MSDDEGGNKDEKFASQYGSSFTETKMTIGVEHMKNFASKDKYHAKWNFKKHDTCGSYAFMQKVKTRLCRVLGDFVENHRSDQRQKRAMFAEKRKYDIEMMEKMNNEKAAGRYSLEYGVDWNRFNE